MSNKRFLVSDQTINSYRCRVLNAGGDTSAFESNPVMLWMHQRGVVIGMWENLQFEGEQLFAVAIFDIQDKGLGEEVGGKVERGFLKAASIGIVVQECVYNEPLDCFDITKWYLQEISIVDIGSNHNALQLYDQSGEPLSELKMASFLETFKPAPKESQTISTPNPMFELKTLALAMGMPETATEQEVLALAATRREQNTAAAELAQLKLQLAADQTSEATILIDQAISDGRIAAPAKEAYLKLFSADHTSAKTILANLTKPQNLVNFAANGSAAQILSGTLSVDDKIKKYDELDKAGTLLKLAQSDRAGFDALYEAKFGKKPDKLVIL